MNFRITGPGKEAGLVSLSHLLLALRAALQGTGTEPGEGSLLPAAGQNMQNSIHAGFSKSGGHLGRHIGIIEITGFLQRILQG